MPNRNRNTRQAYPREAGTGLDRLYIFDQAWRLRCEVFAKVSEHVAGLLGRANAEGKVVAIPARTPNSSTSC